jgi:hypothetical protein
MQGHSTRCGVSWGILLLAKRPSKFEFSHAFIFVNTAILAHEKFHNIIAWLPHGRSWKIMDARKFETQLLPLFFEHSSMSSFIRQANGWGFRRVAKGGSNRDSYYHEVSAAFVILRGSGSKYSSVVIISSGCYIPAASLLAIY